MLSYFHHDGLRLAFLDRFDGGHGTPVLLIHGFASSIATNWEGPAWIKTYAHAGYRVLALENRGHGASDKPYDPSAYATQRMAKDALALLEHLGLDCAFVQGYSMGARIAAFLALAHPERVRAMALGGLGIHLVEGVGLPIGIAEALEVTDKSTISDPTQRMFRLFAEANRGDLSALAACIRGSRQSLTPDEAAQIHTPTLICVGTNDPIAGPARPLAALMPNARSFDIVGRDHNLAVGDKTHRAAVLAFFDEQRGVL
ncbi:MhpC Predicted hydrolases or acyltransferases (alpha/beta hydrolase superfamily) [Rhabdaerophilaceae bacterium]